jgi:hypothetical protein
VLERIQSEIGEFGDLFAGGPDPEDAASVLRALLAGEEIVTEETVTTMHTAESRAASWGE